MSTEIQSKLSATVELAQWVGSILAATAHRFIASNATFLVATSLACLLGSFAYYYKINLAVSNVKETVTSSTPEISTAESTKIDPVPITAAKTVVESVEKDSFPCINLVPTDDVESDSDASEEEDREDWDDADYNQQFSAHNTNNIVSDSEDDDAGDWDEADYNQRFPVSKPTTRRTTSAKKESLLQQPIITTTTTTTTSTTRETRSQMRKRVAREMKESEERRRNQAIAAKAPRSVAPTRKPVRKETVAEMKARVAREFAAKLKQ